jgi:hypothetical protein
MTIKDKSNYDKNTKKTYCKQWSDVTHKISKLRPFNGIEIKWEIIKMPIVIH